MLPVVICDKSIAVPDTIVTIVEPANISPPVTVCPTVKRDVSVKPVIWIVPCDVPVCVVDGKIADIVVSAGISTPPSVIPNPGTKPEIEAKPVIVFTVDKRVPVSDIPKTNKPVCTTAATSAKVNVLAKFKLLMTLVTLPIVIANEPEVIEVQFVPQVELLFDGLKIIGSEENCDQRANCNASACSLFLLIHAK